MTDERSWKDLEERVRAIVAEGRAVRERVADAVASAIAGVRTAAHGAGEVVQRTASGAAAGARQATAESRRGVLRDVVDGVGDGLARSALAARMALEEAGRRGHAFAKQDLERLVRDLGDAGGQVVDAFGRSLACAGDELAGHVDAVRGHAERTREQIEPGLRAAVEAVRQDPLGLAADTASAGAGAARRATGELFDALGALLGEASRRMKRG